MKVTELQIVPIVILIKKYSNENNTIQLVFLEPLCIFAKKLLYDSYY